MATSICLWAVFSSRCRAETRSFLHGAQGKLHVYDLLDEALVYKSAVFLANDWCVSDTPCLSLRPQCVKEEFERQRARWHLLPPQPSRNAEAPPRLSCHTWEGSGGYDQRGCGFSCNYR